MMNDNRNPKIMLFYQCNFSSISQSESRTQPCPVRVSAVPIQKALFNPVELINPAAPLQNLYMLTVII